MPDTFYGVVTAHDTNGTVTWTGIATAVTLNPQSATITKSADIGEVKDGANKVISVGVSNSQNAATFEVIPTHATDASTIAIPAVGTVITTSGFEPTELNGTWNMDTGGSMSTDNGPDGSTKMTLPVKQYADDAALAAV
jgi:hypothetical protein